VELVSLPLLERVRVLDPTRLRGLAPLDLLLLETLPVDAEFDRLPPTRILAVLAVEPGAVLPEGLAPELLGPAARAGSDRAFLLELAARVGGPPDARRWLQLRDPGEFGEMFASRPVAAELEARGARIVGGPSPPVFDESGELLTRF
jgi:hypothetical protein